MRRFLPFWANVWHLLKPYWTSEEKWTAWMLFAGILICNAAQVRLMVVFNMWNKEIYDALQAMAMHTILFLMAEFVIILFLAVIIFTYGNYFGGLLTNRWRRWMTHNYLQRWLSDQHVAYTMGVFNKNMDNPDQRISEDLNEFPTLTLNLVSGLFNAILTLVAFSIVLWNLSGALTIHLTAHHTIHIPGYMFYATIIYATLGSIIMHLIGKNLVWLSYLQEAFNANFRFGLVRVRESSEQVALYRGETAEQQNLKDVFISVFNNFWQIISLQKALGFFSNGYNLLTQVVGLLIALPRYIHERLGIGYLFQTNNAFGQVVDALSFFVTSYVTIASWRAVIKRLNEFTKLIHYTTDEIKEKKILFHQNAVHELTVEHLQLNLPNGEPLMTPLTFSIARGEHTLLMGKFGSGKSTLLRAIANIWIHGTGKIGLPKAAKLLFLPQRPYFPLGTLKQALLYPQHTTDLPDTAFQQALIDCGLPHLQHRLEEIRYWPAEFSQGEQQLIAFARIFLYQPDWVFLDEATSALDEGTEKYIYELLQQKLPDLTMISVGHRSSLRVLHRREIEVPKYPRQELLPQEINEMLMPAPLTLKEIKTLPSL